MGLGLGLLLLPLETAAFRPSAVRMLAAAGGGGYQEQLARARAEKAARQAGGQPFQQPPPQQRAPPPPQQAAAYYQAPPPPQQQQQYQQQYQQPPQSPAQDAVATLLTILGERLGSGQPLSPTRAQAFTRAAEALVAEARAAGAGMAPLPAQRTQQAPPPQQYYSQPPPPPQQQQQQAGNPQGAVYEPRGFEQDEDVPWHLGYALD